MNDCSDGKSVVGVVVKGKPEVALVVNPTAVDVVDDEPVVSTVGGLPVGAVPGCEGVDPQEARSSATMADPTITANACFLPGITMEHAPHEDLSRPSVLRRVESAIVPHPYFTPSYVRQGRERRETVEMKGHFRERSSS
jgi:hypothetical protein